MRQRELGLQQLAGTADMTIDGHPSPFIPGTGARGTVTLVMTCITYPTCIFNSKDVIWYFYASVAVCQELDPVFGFCVSPAVGMYLTVPVYHCITT